MATNRYFLFSFRMIIGKYLLHYSKLYQVTHKEKEKKSRVVGKRIFETSLTMKTIRATQGRKGTKKRGLPCRTSGIVFEDYFLKEKSGNNVNVFSLGTIVRTFNRVINHCPLLPRCSSAVLETLVKIINMEKISVEPRA